MYIFYNKKSENYNDVSTSDWISLINKVVLINDQLKHLVFNIKYKISVDFYKYK